MTNTHWHKFCATLQDLGTELLAAAPDEQTRIEGEAYLARLMAYGVERFLMGPERLVNGISFAVSRIGGYNPDYRMGSANLQGDRRYRLRGRVNGAYRIGLGVYSVAPDGRITTDSYLVPTAKDFTLSPGGTFDLEIAPDAEGGLRLAATSNVLYIRELRLRKDDQPADFSLERLDGADTSSAPTASEIGAGFGAAERFITGSLKQFLHWSSIFAEQPNTITPLDPELNKTVQGDPGTQYYSGYFHLQDTEALVVEMPPLAADYWGIQLTNHWLEPLPASHLNHVTSQPDADGVTRITISRHDPGRGNWLPTGGRARGVIFHRRINAKPAPTPQCTVRSGRD